MKYLSTYLIILICLSSCSGRDIYNPIEFMHFYEPPIPHFEDIYRWSGGFEGEVITLNKKGEFVFHSWTDIIADSVVFYTGIYSLSDSKINFEIKQKHTRKRLYKYLPGYRTMTVDASNSEELFSKFNETLYSIRWDHLEYLISESDIPSFIDDFNRQIEPETFLPNYFLICCDDEVPTSLYPEIPNKFESKLNKSIATIVVTEIKTDSTITVELKGELDFQSGLKLFDNKLVYHVLDENQIKIYDKRRSFYIDFYTNEMTLEDHIVLTEENLEKHAIYVGKNIRVKLP